MSTSFLRAPLVALAAAFICSTLASSVVSAGDRGFRTIAGGKKKFHLNRSDKRQHRRGSRQNDGYGHKSHFRGVLVSLNVQDDEQDLTSGILRDKVTYSPARGHAKIIHVSDQMKRLSEERAARREARMLNNINNIQFGYYRVNEAYDVRFPSVVYLDIPRR